MLFRLSEERSLVDRKLGVVDERVGGIVIFLSGILL